MHVYTYVYTHTRARAHTHTHNSMIYGHGEKHRETGRTRTVSIAKNGTPIVYKTPPTAIHFKPALEI